MKSDNLRTLRGPNLWSNDTLLEAIMVVDSDLHGPVASDDLAVILERYL